MDKTFADTTGTFAEKTPAAPARGKSMDYVVTDFDQVPREFLKIDDEKVCAQIVDGLRAAPGLRIFEV